MSGLYEPFLMGLFEPVRITPRKMALVIHLTSFEHVKKADQSHEQEQMTATKVTEKNKKPQASETSSDTSRSISESDDEATGRCLLVENLTAPNIPPTDPNSPATLQKLATSRASQLII
jgi:hypothetical protein